MDETLGTLLTVAVPPIWSGLLAASLGRSRAARASVLVLGGLGLIAPFYAPTDLALARGGAANLLAVGLFMLIDLARSARPWTWRQRVLRVVGFVDPDRAKSVRPRLGAALIARQWLFFMGSFATLWMFVGIGQAPPDKAALLLRWLLGAVFAYCGFEVMQLSVMIPLGWIGVDTPSFHRNPIFSRSVAEFWGERWNRIISTWLRRHCFAPFVRLGYPQLGMLAAFVVSAVLHGYIMWPALGLGPALSFGGFFLLQPPLIAIERRLGLRRRPAWLARAWTVCALLLFSPLFVEPGVRAFEPLIPPSLVVPWYK